ncbi:MAG: hypothetical protein J6Z22_01125 [Lachnospiraceae bacterium]|nr:hypothetical protein [Lachnospiraceae bacterium]
MEWMNKAMDRVEACFYGLLCLLDSGVLYLREKARRAVSAVRESAMTPQPGIDGILVTVGLCIIALLLCVVMKNSLTTFITSIVSSMTKEAKNILAGNRS